ncbi:hypothetical protein B5U98_17215 [Bosea sp. Tri-39]|nr:hypothetical protein BLM15_06560 [Bosea sp. Tri-49]RXT22163.1 hypothetical protein B5U98_17215 [Bosea sp. Tri-39]RXT32505.1 hypothetical protein B5U99_28060 [Bosea sp. Tri-54]
MIFGLAALGTITTTAPAAAFWPRSQWLACSEAATAADYQRWRCWELDGYAGEIAPGYGGVAPGAQMPPQRRPPLRRGEPVSRLG